MNLTSGRPVIGLILLAPAVVLVSTGLLGLSPPASLSHPALVLGGLLGALVLNAISVLGVRIGYEEGTLVGALRVKVRGAAASLTVLGLGTALLGTITLYLVAENLLAR